ncbi:Conserved Putative secreted protein [Sphingopyxis fribergensis]|uniref:Conserved Putative secreted protein n=1 Tax=Sphingopyxis fribergensis TaxID=1515612 RepID=A0A0A7PLD4_9SPHN|nr:lipase family protein [Sphingopyxis fribergensis]AJA08712.1 Conserved Putative secreted protein [Sphingopyxis fribergensis]
MRHLYAVILVAVLSVFSLPAAAQQPGRLIAATPLPETPPGVQAWRVQYWTTNGNGQRFAVTGIVAAPMEVIPARPRRVIAWTHGAWGVAERCAPSLSPNFFEYSAGMNAVRSGYVVVAPDYIGLGSPTMHPFLVGQDTANAVLDAVRAAREIPGAGAGSSFAAWGESQGGHAALWTATAARSYAPDLTLVATAAAAPPTDLAANLREGSDKNARALLLSFALHSWSTLYGFSLDPITNRTNQGIITRLAQNNCVEFHKKPKLRTILGILTVARATKGKDIENIEPFGAFERANSVDPARVPGPLLIAQSSKDTIVAPAVTRNFAKAVCKGGTPLRWIDMTGDHGASAKDSAQETIGWITARFDGNPPPNDCRRL